MFLLTFAFAVNVVFCVIVTVVAELVKLFGILPAVTVHPLNTYPLVVLAVALIFTVAPCLYVHAPVTLFIHAHLFNVNVCVSLQNHL